MSIKENNTEVNQILAFFKDEKKRSIFLFTLFSLLTLTLILMNLNPLGLLVVLVLFIIALVNGIKLLYINNSVQKIIPKSLESDKRKYIENDLNKHSSVFLRFGYLISILFVLIAFTWKTYDEVGSLYGDVALPDDIEIEPPQTQQKEPEPPPPVIEIEEVEDEQIIEEEIEIEESEADEDTFIEEIVKEEIKEPEVFLVAEKMPSFPGGEKKMYEFLAKNYNYPAFAKENGIEGRIVLRFVVMEDGRIDRVNVVAGLGEECRQCDKEAVRVVKMLPKFNPGMQRNKPVRVWYTLPFELTIRN